MSTKATTTLVVLGTLVIGIVVGVLLGGLLRQEREREIERMLPQRLFQSAMESIIRPTEEQRQALDKIVSKRFEQIAKIREQYQTEVFALHDSLKSDLASVLSEDQLQRLEKHIARGSATLIKIRVDRLTHELQLSEEQQKKIEKIMVAMERKMLRGRHKPPGDSRGIKRMMIKRLDKLHAEIEQVLTPEQKEKYRALQKEMPPVGPEFRPPFEPGHASPFPGPRRKSPPH